MVSIKVLPGSCSSPGEQPSSPRGPCTDGLNGGQQPSPSTLRGKLKELLKRLKPSRPSTGTLARFESAPIEAVTRTSTRTCETTGESASSNVTTDFRHGDSSDIAGGSDSGYSPHSSSSAAFASAGGASGGSPPMGSSPPYLMTLNSRPFGRKSSTRFGNNTGGGGGGGGAASPGAGGAQTNSNNNSQKIHPVADLPSPLAPPAVAINGSGVSGNHSPFEHPGDHLGRFLRASLFTRRSNSSPQNELAATRPSEVAKTPAVQPPPASPPPPRGSSGAVLVRQEVGSPVFPMGGGLPSPAGVGHGGHHALLSCLSGDFFSVMPASEAATSEAATSVAVAPAPTLPPSAPLQLRTAASAMVVSTAVSAALPRMAKGDSAHNSSTLQAYPPAAPPSQLQALFSLRADRLGSGAMDEQALALAAAASASSVGGPYAAGIDIDGGSPPGTLAGGGSGPPTSNSPWARRGSAPEGLPERYLVPAAVPVAGQQQAAPPQPGAAKSPQPPMQPPHVRTAAPTSGRFPLPTAGLEVVTPGSTPRLLATQPHKADQQLPPSAAGSTGSADVGGGAAAPGGDSAAAAVKLSLPQLLRSASTANAQAPNPFVNPVVTAQCPSRQIAYQPPEAAAAKLSAVIAAAARQQPPLAPAPPQPTADARLQQAAPLAARDAPKAPPKAAAADAATMQPTAAPVDVGAEADETAAAAGTDKDASSGGVAPPSLLLCVNPALPKAMDRAEWSLEDYTVVKRLYKGSSAAVYRATCNRSGIAVALKVYFLSRLPDAIKHMVVRELEIHSSAVHPNIIQLYAAFETDKHVVLVMEYASRGDLYGIQRATAEHPYGRRQDEGRVVSVVLRPLLAALAFLHSRGICHRDIKPENVLFTANWQLKLADFGVSIDLGRERAVTRAGTACYMAPEVVRCPLKHRPEDNKNDPRLAYGTACDIWAVGVLAYELLVGFTPLSSAAHGAAAAGAEASQPAKGSGAAGADGGGLMFPGTTSAAARAFVTWCLADQPEDRPTAFQLLHHEWLYPAGASAAVAAAMSSASVVTTAQMVAAAVQAETRICCGAGHS
ncbi:hypothetical protein HYH02_005484 [Chlamydomonas schloesseri]|uniref:Protein kinase domain-containing protein n=1 Tax=Chlamydomonas schloesseri TaxID=2026947 RepID=A0A835WLA1_9CHLO|nr:hypothetical protein HYH02_005484 [Chlamydomonas schloesseri]|eukprot:KAG2449329.1 hypothetical protein HYH02_005484 [Chlamydomonas schloesseri]